jgi:5-methylcytosine-specific restriction enzyme subunit McrC
MPDEQGTGARFQSVLDNEIVMSKVFEDFIRNFYDAHRPEYRVRSERQAWHVTEASQADLALLPYMQTDVTLRNADHTILIDAKFYKESLTTGRTGKEQVRSHHLYQLLTYLQHERFLQKDRGLVGMLIYPEVGRSLRLRYKILQIPVLVATVDLGREWSEVEAELHVLLNECALAAGSPHERDHSLEAIGRPATQAAIAAPGL